MPPEICGTLTDVPGFLVGHASDFKNLTGCTVILCPPGTLGSIDIRGSAAGTRQIDAPSVIILSMKSRPSSWPVAAPSAWTPPVASWNFWRSGARALT